MESRSILFFCHLIVRRALTYAGISRLTSPAGLSSRRPTKTVWRKEAVLRPREIGNLGDKLRPHPMDARESQLASEASLSRRRRGQGHLPNAQRLEATVKESEGLSRHARADASRI